MHQILIKTISANICWKASKLGSTPNLKLQTISGRVSLYGYQLFVYESDIFIMHFLEIN